MANWVSLAAREEAGGSVNALPRRLQRPVSTVANTPNPNASMREKRVFIHSPTTYLASILFADAYQL